VIGERMSRPLKRYGQLFVIETELVQDGRVKKSHLVFAMEM
jgi:hypothetical protein